MPYQHVLIGLDLSEESSQVLDRAKNILENMTSRVSLVHVIEPLSFAYGGDIPMDLSQLQNQIEEQAAKKLAEAAEQLNVPASDQHVLIGQPAHEIHRFARDNDVDLMVVGTHGRHGLSLLFGSTANGVLHGATCDVYAVLIKQN